MPNFTAVAPVNPVPVIVTLVPPTAGPDVGVRPVTVGAGRKVKVPAEVPVPPIVVTLTVTAPVPAADTAVIDVAEFTVKLAAAVAPNATAVAPVNPVPVMSDARAAGSWTGSRRKSSNGRRGDECEGTGRGAGAADRRDAHRHRTSAGGRHSGDLTWPS